jgi:hypothetical protein
MKRGRYVQLAGIASVLASAVAVGTTQPTFAAATRTPVAGADGWTQVDIGDPGLAGSATFDKATGTWTVMGSGADLWGSDNDHFHYASQAVTGDGSITARMLSTTGGHLDDGWEKTGVMIRADDDQDSAMVHTEMTNRNSGMYWHWRASKAGDPHDTPARSPREFPLWQRTQRVSNDFAGYISYDGKTWRNIGFTQNVSDMPDKVNFGLAVMSHEDSTIDTVKWDNVSVNPGQVSVYGLSAAGGDKSATLKWLPLKGAAGYNVYRGPANVGYDELPPDKLTRLTAKSITDTKYTDNDTSLTPATRYVYAVTAVDSKGAETFPVVARAAVGGAASDLPGFTATAIGKNPEKLDDYGIDNPIGDVGAEFNAASGVIRIRGGGHDIWDQADDFTFIHQKVSGNFQVSVNALGFPAFTSDWAKGGLMVREDLTQGSRQADLILASWQGLFFQQRTTKNGDSAPDGVDSPFTPADGRDQLNAGKPITLRLTRTGDIIKAEYSLDGAKFTETPGSPLTLTGLPKDLEVGLAITSHAEGLVSEMLLRDLKITPQ